MIKNNPVVSPVSRPEFRKSVLKLFVFQAVLVCIFLAFLNSEYLNHPMAILYLVGFVVIELIVGRFIFKPNNFQGRLKDIFPDYELKSYKLFFIIFTPLLLLGFITYLLIKEKESQDKVPLFFNTIPFLSITSTLLILSFATPTLSYWLSSPTNYYLYKTISGSREIFELAKLKNQQESGFKIYTNNGKKRLNSSELVLLTALIATDLSKKNNRSVASNQIIMDETTINNLVIFFKEMNSIVQLSENSVTRFSDYGPLQWISPTGLTEIVLLSVTDLQINNKMKEALVTKLANLLGEFEKKVATQPEKIRHQYSKDLIDIRKNLIQTKTYQALKLGT